MKLVFIHGRGQADQDPVSLKNSWETAFEQGLANAGFTRPAGLEIAFPYYGDTLDELVDQFDSLLVADVVERGAEQDDDEAVFRGELINELAHGSGITDDNIREFYTEGVQERGPLNWGWVRATLKALDRSKALGDLAVDIFTRDVYLYLVKPAVQRRIDAIIAPHITEEPCVVVGHSLGSVIGYNILKETSNNVVRFITVGSPLGVNAIKNRLRPPLGMPGTTKSWFNAKARGDFVALYALDCEHFPTTPAIVNNTQVENKTDNQHGIAGYLPDPSVGRAIHEALTS